MKLSRRKDDSYSREGKYEEKSSASKDFGKVPDIDWKIYQTDYTALLPFGKHVNKTLAWVKKEDPYYYEWVLKNNIIASWGLVKLKSKCNPILSEDEEQDSSVTDNYICLIEVPGKNNPSPYL